MEIMKGKFIVIDGSDGSGKATQTKILIDTLKKQKYRIKTIEFPQYGKKSAAMVEQYLTGKYGTANDVGPYVASVFYAVDRYAASFKIRDWLKKGNIVVSNRYVSSNKGHQLTKITGGKNLLTRKVIGIILVAVKEIYMKLTFLILRKQKLCTKN